MHEDSTIKEKKVYQYTCNQLCKEMQLTKFKQILEKVKPANVTEAERSLGAGSYVKPNLESYKVYLAAWALVADKLTHFFYNKMYTVHLTSTHQIHKDKDEKRAFPLHHKLWLSAYVNWKQADQHLIKRLRDKFKPNAVIVIGDWLAPMNRYHEPIWGKSWQTLLKHGRFDVYLIKEYLTSKTCPNCNGRLSNTHDVPNPRPWMRTKRPIVKCHGFLSCQSEKCLESIGKSKGEKEGESEGEKEGESKGDGKYANTDAKYKTIKVPHMADSITEGTLKSWTKQVGEHVEQDEEVASIETDKVDIPVNSPVAGVLRELLANEEDTVVVGQDLFKIEEGAAAEGGAKPKASEAPAAAAIPKAEAKVETSKPEVTTPAASKPAAPAAPKPAASKPVSPPVSFGAPNRSERRVKMNRMRLRISERLKQSQDTAASLTTFNEIDMTNLIDMRKQYKDLVLKTHGVKLGYMGAFVKASSYALQAVPEVNASIDGDHMVYYDYCDVSVAVATPKGLVTPVLRNTERMGIVDVEQEIANLGKKARDNKITVEDMAGGTFTISNGGVFGSLYGTPIINMPQAAILGMHAIKDRPVVVNGEIKIRPMMYVALSYDHRIVDGREAVTFLVKLKEAIEDPRRLLLNV
ncbi:hypothetical protein GGH12_005618 [Coemansia sp. RSA 1822]|nr:hypothetical protein GGH12_005618 [Coemansia sp. RSA 1822]